MAVLLLLSGLWYWLGTQHAFRFVEAQVNEVLASSGLEVSIDRFEGHLLHEVQLQNISVQATDSSALSFIEIEQLELQYFALGLIKRRVDVSALDIVNAQIELYKDSTDAFWCLINRPSNEPTTFGLSIDDFKLHKGSIKLGLGSIEQRLDSLSLDLSIQQKLDKQLVFDLRAASFEWVQQESGQKPSVHSRITWSHQLNWPTSLADPAYLRVQNLLEAQATEVQWPIPRLLQAAIEPSTNNPSFYALEIGAIDQDEALQFYVELGVDWESESVYVKENARMHWNKPKSLGVFFPEELGLSLAAIEIQNQADFRVGFDGKSQDRLQFTAGIQGINSELALREISLESQHVLSLQTRHLASDWGFTTQYSGDRLNYSTQIRNDNSRFVIELESEKKDTFLDAWVDMEALGMGDYKEAFIGEMLHRQRLVFNPSDGFFEGQINILSKDIGLHRVQIDSLQLVGPYSAISANLALDLTSNAGELHGQLFGVHFEESIEHEFKLAIQGMDLGPLLGVPNFKTNISGTGTVIGSGKNPFDTESAIDFSFTPSMIQQARVDSARLDASLKNGLLNVDDLQLSSDLAEGILKAELDLNDLLSARNTLEGYFNILDLQSLAPLFRLDTLNLQGSVTAKISPGIDGRIYALSGLSLENIQIGKQQSIKSIEGIINVPMEPQPEIVTSLEIIEPVIGALYLTNLTTRSVAQLTDTGLKGKLDLSFDNQNLAGAELHSSYVWSPDSTTVDVDYFAFRHDPDTLSSQYPFTIRLNEERLLVNEFRLLNQNDGTQVQGQLYYAADSLYGFLRAESFNLLRAQRCFLAEEYAQGILKADMWVYGDSQQTTYNGALAVDSLGIGSINLPHLKANLYGNHERMHLQARVHQEPPTPKGSDLPLIQLEADIPFGGNLFVPDIQEMAFIQLDINEHKSAHMQSLLGLKETPTQAIAKASLTLNQSLANPNLDLQMQLREIKDGRNLLADSLYILGNRRRNDSSLILRAKSWNQYKMPLEAELTTNYTQSKGQKFELPIGLSSSVEGWIKAHAFDLRLLNAIQSFSPYSYVEEGQLDANYTLKGTLESPEIEGQLLAQKLRLRLPEYGLSTEGGTIRISTKQQKSVIEEGLLLVDKGQMKFKGFVQLPYQDLPYALSSEAELTNFLFLNNPLGSLRADGTLAFTSTTERNRLEGSIAVGKGRLNINQLNSGDANIEQIELNEDGEAVDEDPSEMPMDVKLSVSIRDDLQFRSQGFPQAELFGSGRLDVIQSAESGDSLQVFGGLESSRGFVDVLGKRFSIQPSKLVFDGSPTNPLLRIESLYKVPKPHEVQIRHFLTGRLQDPEVSYESEPVMEDQNIYSYILFNKPFYALEGWQQTLADTDTRGGGDATNIALQLLTNRIEQLASQRLGIDLVQIDNTRSGSRNATTLKTGWYLNEKTFFVIMNELGVTNPETQFILEYLLAKDLNVVVTQGNQEGARFDLRWQYDY